jgi:choline dehydrogenase-like flavoprotein
MKRLQSADVVIVGAGWAGLSMAKELATRTGLSVLVLERGQAREFRLRVLDGRSRLCDPPPNDAEYGR